MDNDQHIYHHNEPHEPQVNMSIEKNSRGFNYTVTVINARSVAEAIALLREAREKLEAELGAVKESDK